MRPAALAFAVSLGVFVAGCGHNIGDSCSVNVDCQPDGTRFCDTSPPDGQGYCTIDGCDFSTCPGEAVCIRFLTPVLDEPCTISVTDRPVPLGRADCPHADDRCVCDNAVKGVCQSASPNGHCAPEATERRWCQLRCSSNGDCRSNYECRATGTLGAEPIPTVQTPAGEPTSFCAPNRPAPSPAP